MLNNSKRLAVFENGIGLRVTIPNDAKAWIFSDENHLSKEISK